MRPDWFSAIGSVLWGRAMNTDSDAVYPSIKIFVHSEFNRDDVLREIKCGVEEESVPYQVHVAGDNDSTALSYAAAHESSLEVGIGVDKAGCLAVHYNKLPKSSPIFKINYTGEFSRIRSTCSNAARLVKGTPFILE